MNSEPGSPSGQAYVEFASVEDSKAEMVKGRMTLWITLHTVICFIHSQMEEAISRVIPLCSGLCYFVVVISVSLVLYIVTSYMVWPRGWICGLCKYNISYFLYYYYKIFFKENLIRDI
ncbi:heterogeneous nuclear ribonucleoprotein F [Spatholobus suberectus]|nr:heterogeneous nuclear ribonucleoprotein F [Spatholobus suberectus]